MQQQLLVLSRGQDAHVLWRMVLQQQATHHVAFQSSKLPGWQGVPGRQLYGELAVGVEAIIVTHVNMKQEVKQQPQSSLVCFLPDQKNCQFRFPDSQCRSTYSKYKYKNNSTYASTHPICAHQYSTSQNSEN